MLRIQSESLITLYRGLEETQGRMQGDKTEQKRKAYATSSTKVVDDVIHPDNLRNDGKELVTEWLTSGGGTTKVSSTTMTPSFTKEVRGHSEKELGNK